MLNHSHVGSITWVSNFEKRNAGCWFEFPYKNIQVIHVCHIYNLHMFTPSYHCLHMFPKCWCELSKMKEYLWTLRPDILANLTSTSAEVTPFVGIIVICTDNIYNIYISQYYLINNMYIYIYTYISHYLTGKWTGINHLYPGFYCHVATFAKVEHLAERWRGRFLTDWYRWSIRFDANRISYWIKYILIICP